ncbi:MAG: hypothetical protein ABIV51_13830 [Saprospiraceae bacterium]
MELIESFTPDLLAWAREFVQNRIRDARAAGLVDTQELLNSFASTAVNQAAESLIFIGFAFQEYGRYFDMKKVKYLGLLPLDEIQAWVIRKGVERFKTTKSRTYKGADKEKIANQIAWGISKSRSTGKSKLKRKPWYNTSKSRDINRLIIDLIAHSGDFMTDSIKTELKS